MTDIPARAGASETPTRTLRRPRPEPPAPLAEEEIRDTAIRPDRLADLVLARPDRIPADPKTGDTALVLDPMEWLRRLTNQIPDAGIASSAVWECDA